MSKKNGKHKPETRHIRKLAGGSMTPQEMHRAIGLRKRCVGCGQPAAVRIKVLVQLSELVKRQPEFVAQIMATNPEGPVMPTVPTKFGPMVKVSDVGACELCRKTAMVTAARAPSWALVEIDEGPKNTTQVQVPS